MAYRSHVDVSERRLRPIYDCLDNGNNKKAIQEAEKVLRKQKDFQCAKVLKALALLRLGRHDDSSALLQEVHSQHPTEEATLHAMAICYREVHKSDLIVDLYENAFKGRPDNEEILSALFMAYVRQGDYKKQQHTAMALHKLRPKKNPYYFWAIMSIVMQAHFSKDKKLSEKMFLPLAQRMAQKYVKEEKIEAEAEVQMYLIILELLGQTEEALSVVQSPLAEKLVSELNYVSKKSAELLCKLERWPEANKACRENLLQDCDDWPNWLGYLTSVFHLSESQWTPPPDREDWVDCIDFTVEKAVKFIHQDVKKTVPDSRLRRGPYLAELELFKRLRQSENTDLTTIGSVLDLFQKFFELFGDKNSCCSDLQPYVELLTQSERTQFLENIWQTLGLDSNTDGEMIYASTVKQMYRHITYLQLKRVTGGGLAMSSQEKLHLAKELADRYAKGLDFGKDLLPTDMQYADNYIILCVHFMIDVWNDTGDEKLVWQMIIHLEKAVLSSPSNFQLKLLLVQLYCRMGVFGPCPALYDAMEIKHIMNDTLAHILFNHVSRLGHMVSASAMYGTMLRFFTVNHKETAEYLISSYKYGSFTKIYEFVKFREKLQNSLQFAMATAERLILDLILETDNHNSSEQIMAYMEIDPEQDKTNFEELCDNRDFSVMFVWEPPNTIDLKEIKLKSFEEEKAWLKLRNLQLRILSAGISVGKHSQEHSNNGISENGEKSLVDILQELNNELNAHLNMCQEKFSTPAQYPLQGPFRTRLSSFLSGKHRVLFSGMVENVIYCHKLREDGIEKCESVMEEKLKKTTVSVANELVNANDKKLISESDSGCSLQHEIIEQYVLTAESLAHSTVLAGVCHRLLKPLKTTFMRKVKKRKDVNQVTPESFDSFGELVEGLTKAVQDLHKQSHSLDPVFLSVDLSNLHLSSPPSDSQEDKLAESEMWKGVESSYQQTAKQIGDFLHTKMHYLNGLKL